jgi:hypothetical protein
MPLEMEKFNINELAGATGLILGAVSGILVVIFKSRCYCKFRVGFNDKCSICMCERKPPPDPDDSDDEDKNKQDKILKKEEKILKEEEKIEQDIESLIPTKSKSPKMKIDISEKEDLM